MGGARGSRLGGLVLSAVTGLAALSGCRPVEFRMPGRADDGGSAVLGLGGATPYLRSLPVRTWAHAPAAAPPTLLDVYAATRPGMLSPAVRRLPTRLYVPSRTGIDVLDPGSYRPVGDIKLAARAVVPSWDLRRLWAVTADALVSLDPRTGRPERRVPVRNPGRLYFTPDGRQALLLSRGTVEIRDPQSMRPLASLALPCRAVGHLDFTADGGTALASCAASGRLVALTTGDRRVTGSLDLPHGHPEQVMLAPDGSRFFVSDPVRGGVWMIDSRSPRSAGSGVGFLATGRGAYDLLVSRDGSTLYVADRGDGRADGGDGRAGRSDGRAGRGDGKIVSISFATRRTTAVWTIPGHRIGALAGLSTDGTALWLTTGRTLLALSTADGHLLHTVPADTFPGAAPCLFPQPGRHSLGTTMR
jgi:hypothetical protein